ncbi:class I SAM-dependent RNA methyltransferase [Bradyrhizobium sp. WD16]|uniref:class I SAM-dependent RNA methyltransferase n=1 Tax=Bradyrhizobium sp. WD16 TaxID=1521768 RepID=UPI0020A39AA7|nr:methyltransferase [Bradyrhizobium sp. WD16]UTD25609.1 RNA methyltransferase [Bradyrhizobium sp. WD16]
MTERLVIDHVGHRGDGVAMIEERTVYVPGALAGEEVVVEAIPGHPERLRLVVVERASTERIAPFCPHFGACGGCAIQHWQMGAYRAWKRDIVVTALRQASIDCAVNELIDAHGSGRRRITAHARRGRDGVWRSGFAAAASHDIVAIDHCPVLEGALNDAFAAANAIAQALAAGGKPLDIQVTATLNGLDIDIRGSGPLPPNTALALTRLATTHRIARLTRHGELVVQHAPPQIRMGKAVVTLPPGSFLQATDAGEETLARLVGEAIGKARHVMDLFCGVGPFALRLAERARVTAFDSDAGAIAALAKAAATVRGLKPITATARDLFRRPLVAAELREVDAVVFDPPRQGAQTQASQLAASKVPLVIAVSCNPASFARDARLLLDGGYRCNGVTPVDQFRHSPHVELVAQFVR